MIPEMNASSFDTGARIIDKRRNWEARVEMAVFKRSSSELSAYDKLVYAILCGHANRYGICLQQSSLTLCCQYPKYNALSHRCIPQRDNSGSGLPSA